ncbi:MAG: MFS transporter [Actinobacteria bacterium]|nr:MAG: MFS transporter [Actinomycetota bacterium]
MEELAFGSRAGRWVLAVAVLGSGMAFLDGTVVNVAVPKIGEDLHASTSSLQWILNGYQLTLASLILLGGSLGDRNGRRRIFQIGTGLFTVASLLCAAAPTAEALIGARFVQGIGGALLTPGSLAMIEATFRAQDRPRAIGAWSGLTGVSTALGPLVGGYLVSAVSWRAVFLINLPIGALVIVAAARHVPETRDPTAHGHLDVRGASLAALGLAGITYALIEGPGRGFSALIVASAAVGVAAFAAFLAVERRSPNPMMPLGIFSSRQFSAANLVTFVVYAALGGFFFLTVSFLQISLGYSPVASGAATLPVTALMLALSARSGALAQRIGPRIPLTVGPLVVAVGLLMLTGVNPGDSYLTSVLPGVVVFGLGLTLVVSPVTATVLAAADARHAGMASGINNAVARVASLVAVAVLPLIGGLTGNRFYQPAHMTHGFHVAMIACAILAAAGGVLAWLTISDDVLEAEPKRRGQPPVAVSCDYSCSVAGPPAPATALDQVTGGGLPSTLAGSAGSQSHT